MNSVISINNIRKPFETTENICGISAQKTGFISFIIQFFSLILSALIVSCLFFHIGGFIQIFPNSTITKTFNNLTKTFPIIIENNFQNVKKIEKILNSTKEVKQTIKTLKENLTTNKPIYNSSIIVYHGPFEQVQNVTIKIKKFKIDLLVILKESSLVYIVLCMCWLLTILGLLIMLKFKILDLVFINTLCLIAITICAIINSILIGLVIFYQVI